MPCNIAIEDAWGPVVPASCLQGFDFTLLFEESILTILPLTLTGTMLGLAHVYLLGYSC